MPGCQGHNLLAGGKITGSHPCTLARGWVPTGGHGKGYLFQGKKSMLYITSHILKQIFFQKNQGFLDSWKPSSLFTALKKKNKPWLSIPYILLGWSVFSGVRHLNLNPGPATYQFYDQACYFTVWQLSFLLSRTRGITPTVLVRTCWLIHVKSLLRVLLC